MFNTVRERERENPFSLLQKLIVKMRQYLVTLDCPNPIKGIWS